MPVAPRRDALMTGLVPRKTRRMAHYTFSELDARDAPLARDVSGTSGWRWPRVLGLAGSPSTRRERAPRIDARCGSGRPAAHPAQRATIWSRAIYPLLVLAGRPRGAGVRAGPLEPVFARFELAGTLGGALATNLSGTVEAPFPVVVEAKRGLEAVNPQW